MRKQVCSKHAAGAALGAAVLTSVRVVLTLMVTVVGRFVSGRPMVREPGPADSTYRDWAPSLGPELPRMRVVVPRTTWGRRPGWHRQLVRLLGVAVVVAFLVVPVLTVGALLGVGAMGIAEAVRRTRPTSPTAVPASAAPPSAVEIERQALQLQQMYGGDLDAWMARVLLADDSPSPRASRADTATAWRGMYVDAPPYAGMGEQAAAGPVYAHAERMDRGGAQR